MFGRSFQNFRNYRAPVRKSFWTFRTCRSRFGGWRKTVTSNQVFLQGCVRALGKGIHFIQISQNCRVRVIGGVHNSQNSRVSTRFTTSYPKDNNLRNIYLLHINFTPPAAAFHSPLFSRYQAEVFVILLCVRILTSYGAGYRYRVCWIKRCSPLIRATAWPKMTWESAAWTSSRAKLDTWVTTAPNLTGSRGR